LQNTLKQTGLMACDCHITHLFVKDNGVEAEKVIGFARKNAILVYASSNRGLAEKIF